MKNYDFQIMRLSAAPVDLNSYRRDIQIIQEKEPKDPPEVKLTKNFEQWAATFMAQSMSFEVTKEDHTDTCSVALSLLNNQ